MPSAYAVASAFFGVAFFAGDFLAAAFFAGAFLVPDVVVVLLTRPDLVFLSSVGLSTTAGAYKVNMLA